MSSVSKETQSDSNQAGANDVADSCDVAALNIANVGYSYNDHLAIRDVTFDVKTGEVFGLVGLNGAGKTTLMKSILGLLNNYSGQIHIFGADAADHKSRKKLTFLPEKFEPSWFLTGREFIQFSSRFYNRVLDDATIENAAKSLELDVGFLNRKVQSYSKGMRQKLGLISAFLSGCPLIMLDEPMSGLDPKARIFVKNLITDAKKQGRTVFFSSHILSDMDELCDRIGIIHARHLCFLGTPDALKKQTGENNLERAFLHIAAQVDGEPQKQTQTQPDVSAA